MAAGDQNIVYGSTGASPASAGAATITLASLGASANGISGQAGTAIDNTTVKALDCLLQLKGKNGSGTIAGNKGWWLFVGGGSDASGSFLYADRMTGSDASFTRTDPPIMHGIFIPAPTSATSFESDTISVASMFGGTLPPKFVPFVANDTNITADTTAGNFALTFEFTYGHQS